MTNYKGKMTSIKIILFTSLIVAMILPFSSMNVAEASHTIDESEIIENNAQIQEYLDQAILDGEIPSMELLDRFDSKWLDEYDNIQHFDKTQGAMNFFVDSPFERNGVNEVNRDHVIKIQNFETITGAIGSGYDVVLLVAELEKQRGIYNPSEPVSKFHYYLTNLPDTDTVPESENDIRDILEIIVGDKKFLPLAYQAANSFNAIVDLGNAPDQLDEQDPDYWAEISVIALCDADPECDADAIRNHVPPTDAEIKEAMRIDSLNQISFDLWDLILPQAYALKYKKIQVDYTLVGEVRLVACMYVGCNHKWTETNSNGSETIDHDHWRTGTNMEHALRGYNMKFKGSACETYTGTQTVINDVTTTPYLALSLKTNYELSDTEYTSSCASTTKNISATNPWITGIKVTSVGSYYWQIT